MNIKKPRKTLGTYDSPYIVSLMRLIETQSKATVANWCMDYCEAHILPIYEMHFCGDYRVRHAIEAARDWFAGKKKLREVKNIILNECHVAARECDKNPAAQAAARACGQAAACCHLPMHSLGLAFYGTAAIAYERYGTGESAEFYDDIAAKECAKMESALQSVAV